MEGEAAWTDDNPVPREAEVAAETRDARHADEVLKVSSDPLHQVGSLLARRPCTALAWTGGAMLFVGLLGPALAPLQFDASVKGFAPRGTPMALRINTGIQLQAGFADQTLQGFPDADCSAPPVELWLALCGSQAAGNADTSTVFGAATVLGDLLARLAGECSPICMTTVAPWYRECTEQTRLGLGDLAGIVADAIMDKLPATAQAGLALALATGQAKCASAADCVSDMLRTCDARLTQTLRDNNADMAPSATGSSSGHAAQSNDRDFCHVLHSDDVDSLNLGVYYEAVADNDLLSAAALHEVCEFESRVLSYAGEQGYCQRRGMSQAHLDAKEAACCPARSYAQMLVWLLDKDCASISDDDIQTVVRHVQACDAAQSESCVPRWIAAPCTTDSDCAEIDSTCRSTIAMCLDSQCVDRCETAGQAGMIVPLLGDVSGDALKDKLGGTVYTNLIYEFFDAGFAASGRVALSQGSFPFINAIHRNGEDFSQIRSKQQLLSLYNNILLEASQPSEGATVKVLASEGVLMMDVVNQILISDVLHVVGALVVVFIAMVVHTGSLFISAMGMAHVVLAFPAAYTTYRLLFGIKWMSLLNYIGIFVAVGIGADDIFVYTDAWRQAAVMLPPGVPLDVRITWTLRRAGSAMFVTSATTCAAFATNYVNSVVPMQLFGIFMSLMVFWDYVFTVTWFPCVVAVYHVYVEPRFGSHHPCSRCNFMSKDRSGAMSDRSEGLTAGQINTVDNEKGIDKDQVPEPTSQRRIEVWFRDSVAPTIHIYRVYIVAVILLLTIPLAVLTFSIQLDEGGIQAFPLWHDQRQYMMIKNHPREHFRSAPNSHWRGTTVQLAFGIVASDSGDRFDPDDQGVIQFDDDFDANDAEAQTWLLETIRSARQQPFTMPAFLYPTVTVASAHGTASDGQPCARESTIALAVDSNIASFWSINDCEVDDGGSTVLEFNFLGGDRHSLMLCEQYPAYCLTLGPKLLDRVDILWGAGQAAGGYRVEGALYPGQWHEITSIDALSPDRPSDSIHLGWSSFAFLRISFRGQGAAIAELSAWGEQPSVVEMMHAVSSALPSNSVCGGGLPLDNFVECSGQLARLSIDSLTGNVTGLPGALVFDGNGRSQLKGIVASFHTTVGQGVVESWEYHKVAPSMQQWNDFVAARLAVAPPTSATAWAACLAYMAAETQTALRSACWRAGLLSLAIAFAVLVGSTRSLTVSLLATGAIATILFWTVGAVVASGWQLGIMESMDIAILIGISCDFVVHFSHSYCACPRDGQQERMTHSLYTMGISVIAAAATTFLASAVLSLCTLTFFDKFGSFLCVTMVTSVILSVIFFQAVLATVGPAKPDRLSLVTLASRLGAKPAASEDTSG